MFEKVTRKLTPPISVETTVRLNAEWLLAEIAADANHNEGGRDAATTRETSFEAPTSPTRYLAPLIPDTRPEQSVVDRRVRDMNESIAQFAEFGFDRCRGELDSAVVFDRDQLPGSHRCAQLVREYLALHQRCTDGLSVADIAATNSRYIESTTRRFIDRLALSYWDLYEVVGVREDRATLTSRIDAKLHVIQYLEGSIQVGDVIVARVVDIGGTSVVSSVVVPTCAQTAELTNLLHDSFVGRSWSGFMRGVGAAIVLRWVLASCGISAS